MKKTIFTLIFAIGMIANTFGQTVMIKSVEKAGSNSAMVKPALYIVDEDGNSSIIQLEKKGFNIGIENNMKELQKALNKYLDKGYIIISSTSSGFGVGNVVGVITTYILRKE